MKNDFNKIRLVIPVSVVPDFELEYKLKIVSEINTLAKKKNALILKHNYMEPVLFYAVDGFSGDSLELSKKAANTNAKRIIFCGVNFMAETAKILNPKKKVFIPSLKAGCSLADNINAEDVRSLKKMFPGLPVVTYVNTTAETKAESDYCCTSGNSRKIIETAMSEFKTKSVIFIPDKYMAKNVASEMETKVFIVDKEKQQKIPDYKNESYIIGWNARCYVHEQYKIEHIKAIKKDYPDAIILAHPECPPEVVAASDFSGSTSAMIKYVKENSKNKKIALLTECSMSDNILTENPEYSQNLIRMCNLRCMFMHMISLEQLRDCLLFDRYEVKIPEKIRLKAEKAVKRMLT